MLNNVLVLGWSFLQIIAAMIVHNPGFELRSLASTWDGNGGSIQVVTNDVYAGKQAARCFNRTSASQGAAQNVSLAVATRYRFRARVKQLNGDTGKLFQRYKAVLSFSWHDNAPDVHVQLAENPYSQKNKGWFALEGDVLTPTKHFRTAKLNIEGPDPGIDFLMDDILLEEISKQESGNMTFEIRMNKIHFIITHEQNLNSIDLTVKIDHKQHLFGFGSRVHQNWITNQTYREYQNVFYYLFNWGSVPYFQWPSSAQVDYTETIKAADVLQKHGLKVHTESPFPSTSDNFPSWIQHMDGPTLNQTIVKWIQDFTGFMTGQVDSLDVVQNIMESGFYLQKTGDPTYFEKICKMIHDAFPSSQMLVTDRNLLINGYQLTAFKEVVETLKPFGLTGIGATAHFTSDNLDPTLLKMHLDSLWNLGLPIWITQLSVSALDESVRADVLEKALRIFFNHPAVEGVMLLNFLDHHNAPDMALFEGFDFQANAAGQRYVKLVKQEWSTHISRNLSMGTSFTMNGFHGDYDVTVYNKGKPIMLRKLQLGKSDMIYEMHVTGNGDEINLPTTSNPFSYSTHNYNVSYIDGHRIGTALSNGTETHFQCETRWSAVSEVGDNKTTQISCVGDKILTGCSSMKANISDYFTRDGEYFKEQNGKIFCVASNGIGSKHGVYAVARCCSAKHFRCEYRTSGYSDRHWASQIGTHCSSIYHATGCLNYQTDMSLHGAFPNEDGKGCLAEKGDPKFGVQSSAACCAVHVLSCVTLRSTVSGLNVNDTASVACHSGYTMTSCNFYGRDGKSAGAYITDQTDMCVAVNGADRTAGQEGVSAVAVCCKISHSPPVIG